MRSEPIPTRALIAGLLSVATLMLVASRYYPYVPDDAFISLRYARRLIQGLGLTFTEGERVEGYSNLLWVLAVSAPGALGFDLVSVARVLGVVCTAVSLLAIAWHHGRRVPAAPAVATALTCQAMAVAPPIAIWSIGCLEQPLLVLLLTLAALDLGDRVLSNHSPARTALLPGLFLGLAAVTRPDAPLFTGGLVLGWVLARGITRRDLPFLLVLAGMAATFYGLQLAFRCTYYGELVPNTAAVKLGPTQRGIQDGFAYLGSGFLSLAPLLVVLLIGFPARLWSPASRGAPGSTPSETAAATAGVLRRRAFLFAVPAVLWSGYLVFIGGDFMPAHRHLAPVVPFLVLILGDVLHIPGGHRPTTGRASLALLALAGLGVLALGATHLTAPTAVECWAWDGRAVGALFKDVFGPKRPLLAVDAAGVIPFESELPAIDMLGLADRHIAGAPRDPRYTTAHQHGDGAYVLGRKPDLVIFCGTGGGDPCFRTGLEMVHDPVLGPKFRKEYRPAIFETTATTGTRSFHTKAWIRVEGRIGVTRAGSVTVPAHLITANPASPVRRDPAGRLYVEIDRTEVVSVWELHAARGAWSLEVDASAPVKACIRASSDRQAPCSRHITLTAAGPLDVAVTAETVRARVYRLRINPAAGSR